MKKSLAIGLSIIALLSSGCITSCSGKYVHKYLPIEISKLDSKGKVESLTIFNYENKYKDCSITNFNVVNDDRFERFVCNTQYDDNGLLCIKEFINNNEYGVFMDASKEEYIYNKLNLVSTVLYYFKNDTTPIYNSTFKDVYEYSSTGNVSLFSVYQYDNEEKAFLPISNTSYIYDESNTLKEKIYEYPDGRKEKVSYYTENYKKITLYSTKTSTDTDYIDYYKEEYSSSKQINGTTKEMTNEYEYIGGEWLMSRFKSFTYDIDNRLLVEEFRDYDNGVFIYGHKNEYEYNNHNQITKIVNSEKHKNDTGYKIKTISNQYYNEAHILYKIEHLDSQSILQSIELYTFDNKGNISSIEYFDSLNDNEFVMTGSYEVKFKTVTTLKNMYTDFDPFDYI